MLRDDLQVLRGHTGVVSSVAQFGSGGRGDKIVTGSWDRSARVWDTESGTTYQVLNGEALLCRYLVLRGNWWEGVTRKLVGRSQSISPPVFRSTFCRGQSYQTELTHEWHAMTRLTGRTDAVHRTTVTLIRAHSYTIAPDPCSAVCRSRPNHCGAFGRKGFRMKKKEKKKR